MSTEPVTYLSHDWPTRATPDAQQRQQGFVFLQTMRRSPPGTGTDNRWEQVRHYRGVVYIAIRAIMSLAGGATYECLKRKKRHRGRTTFGPRGSVAKSVALPQSHGRDEDYVPVDDLEHPIAARLERPNPNETFGELTGKIILQNRLTGLGPLWAVPNAKGRPVELWALKTPYLYPLWQASKQYPNGVWRVMPQASAGWSGSLPHGLSMSGAMLPGEEVKRFLEPHPMIDWDGWSPLTAGAHELDVLESIQESRKSAMDQGLNLDVVAILPGMDQSELNRFTASTTEKAAGSRNHRKFIAFAPPAGTGPQDKPLLETLGQSPKDMDYSTGYGQHVKFALALFGVPDAVAFLSEAGSYSQDYSAQRAFQSRQKQFFNDIASWYTKVLCWPWESFPGEYLIHIKLPPIEDVELLEKQLQTDKGIRSVNERRAQRDLPPVEDGDWPEDIFLEVLKQRVAPPPQPMPGAEGVPQEGDEQGAGDPLAALLGTGPQSAPGGVPQPDNDAAEGSGVPTVGKAAKQTRREGEVWQSGKRWYTVKDGKTVPAKNPGKQAPAPKAPKGPTKKEQKQTARAAAEQEKTAGRARVAEVGTKLRDGGSITHEDALALDANLKHLDVGELKELNRVIGAKVSVAKAKLIDQAVAHAKALAAGQKSPHAKPVKPEKPVKAPKVGKPASSPVAGTRAHMDALGIPHDHLSDDEVEETMRAAFGGKKPAAPAPAPAKPGAKPKPAAGGEKVDASAKELEATIDTLAVISPEEAEKHLAKLQADHTDDELREIARRVTGKGGRTGKQALELIRHDLVAVHRALESQKV